MVYSYTPTLQDKVGRAVWCLTDRKDPGGGLGSVKGRSFVGCEMGVSVSVKSDMWVWNVEIRKGGEIKRFGAGRDGEWGGRARGELI